MTLMFIKLAVQILTNTIAIYIASEIVNGFNFTKYDFVTFLTTGFIFGMINFFIKPILKIVSIPLIIFTFGLFTIVINIAMLFLLDYFVPELTIASFSSAFWSAIVISAVNFFIGAFSKK